FWVCWVAAVALPGRARCGGLRRSRAMQPNRHAACPTPLSLRVAGHGHRLPEAAPAPNAAPRPAFRFSLNGDGVRLATFAPAWWGEGTSMAGDTSAELLSRWRKGDEEAASALFRRYAEQLIVLARGHLSEKLAHRLDPQDVVQSAYRSFFTGA